MILPCPLCQARFDVPDELVGKPETIIRCPKCKFSFALRDQVALSGPDRASDTDPAVDPALAAAIQQAALESEGDEDTGDTEVEVSPELVEQIRAEAALHGGTVDEEESDSAQTRETERSGGVEGGSEGAPESVPGEAPGQAAVAEPDAASAIPAEAQSESDTLKMEKPAAEGEVAEAIELEEVDPEVRPLSPEELAKLSEEEIVDADDLAQLAETSGETEVKEKLNPKAEAEAAGQWPSIIVEDNLLASAAAEAEPEKPSQEAPSPAAVLASHRQAYEAAHRRAVAAQRAVNALTKRPEGVDRAQLARAQRELNLALTQLQIAQERFRKAQAEYQRLEAAARGSTAPAAAQPGPGPVQASQAVAQPAQASPAAAVPQPAPAAPPRSAQTPRAGSATADVPRARVQDEPPDEAMPAGSSKGWLWAVGGLALVAGAVALYFVLNGSGHSSAAGPGAETGTGTASDAVTRMWSQILISKRKVRLIRRRGRPAIVIVEAELKNGSKDYEFRSPFVEVELLENGRQADSMVVPCGNSFPDSEVVKLVDRSGREGFKETLRRSLAHMGTDVSVKPGQSTVCQAVLFTNARSEGDIQVRVKVDQDKTIAAPIR